MGRYLKLTWITSAPVSAGISENDACILCSGNAPDGASNPQLVTNNTYTDVLTDTNRWEYTALESYYRNYQSPTNNTYLYWMGDGEEATGIAEGTGMDWSIPYGPFDSVDTVWVDPTGGANWQEIDAFDISTCESGWTAVTGDHSKYNGEIYFSGVYVDADSLDDGGPAFGSGGTDYSGQLARDIMSVSGGRIQIRATRNGFGVASKDVKDLNVQFVCPAYNVGAETGIMGDSTGSIEDLQNCLGMCGGNRMMTVWALPASATPGSTYPDAAVSANAENVRDYIGQDQNAALIYADVVTGLDSTGDYDPATSYLGAICATHPHTPLTLAPINIGLVKRANLQDQNAWAEGQIACVIRQSELNFSTDQISYGYTLAGTSPNNRLNNVRCRYLVEFNILSDLWSLLSSRTVRISQAGIDKIKSKINATLNRMESKGYIDNGPRRVEIPLENGTNDEWDWARANRKIPSIRIRWSWYESPEELNITHFGEL